MSDFIDRLVPLTEGAQALGVSVSTLRWWAQMGKIVTHKFGTPGGKRGGGRRLIPLSEINRLISESRIPARAVEQ